MGRPTAEAQRVALAKQRLRNTSPQSPVDYLAPVKQHPIASVGAAFLLGMMLRGPKGKLPVSLLSIGLQQFLKRL